MYLWNLRAYEIYLNYSIYVNSMLHHLFRRVYFTWWTIAHVKRKKKEWTRGCYLTREPIFRYAPRRKLRNKSALSSCARVILIRAISRWLFFSPPGDDRVDKPTTTILSGHARQVPRSRNNSLCIEVRYLLINSPLKMFSIPGRLPSVKCISCQMDQDDATPLNDDSVHCNTKQWNIDIYGSLLQAVLLRMP